MVKRVLAYCLFPRRPFTRRMWCVATKDVAEDDMGHQFAFSLKHTQEQPSACVSSEHVWRTYEIVDFVCSFVLKILYHSMDSSVHCTLMREATSLFIVLRSPLWLTTESDGKSSCDGVWTKWIIIDILLEKYIHFDPFVSALVGSFLLGKWKSKQKRP